MIALVSVSGGKDSTATLLVALERLPREQVRAAFADTGNEHEATYAYIDHLEKRLGLTITRLRPDFTDWWWRRRDYVRDKWTEKGVPDDVVRRALAVFEAGPTGNPYLDLCVIKGRFPSRAAQFCTQYLKTEPLTELALGLIEQRGAVESWQGVRAEESIERASLLEREDQGGGLTIYRPILQWRAAQVFQQHRKHGVDPNPLYLQGADRVGCMPCINANKDGILNISKRWPEHIDRIAEWERVVADASKRGGATFFPSSGDNATAMERGNIRAVVEWSQTQRGGKLIDWIRVHEDPKACASAYGLCE